MRTLKKTLGFVVLSTVIAGFVYALAPGALEVQVAPVRRGPMRATIEAQGKARVRTRYRVSAPAVGHMTRPMVRVGDDVKQGESLATLTAGVPPLLDARTKAEARARLMSAHAATEAAIAAEGRAKLALAQAERELERTRKLAESGAVSSQQIDNAESTARLQEQEVRGASYAVERARADWSLAQAALRETEAPAQTGTPYVVRAPISGKVLRVEQEHETVVQAGATLFELGDLASLEIVVDMPTTQAVRVRPGAEVGLIRWGGAAPLPARVREVEPSAFTKVTALGVEEQRVNVIIDPSADSCTALGDGYQVDARIVVWEKLDALKIPTGALVRDRSGWAAFVDVDGRAERHVVQIGQMNAQDAEVLSGLSEGQQVVLYPGDRLNAGQRLRTTVEAPRTAIAER